MKWSRRVVLSIGVLSLSMMYLPEGGSAILLPYLLISALFVFS